VLLLAALLPVLAAQPDRFGLPSCDAPHLEFAARQAFVLCHDSSRKVPAWTAYELTPAQLEQPAQPRPSRFHSDSTLQSPGATNADYTHSGFHRGHLVPARDLANSPQTFVLSNAAPQNPSLNMGRWRQLENTVRTLAASSDALYIVTGTLFASEQPATIGPGRVGVPTHFYKAILAIQGSRKMMFAVILPNSPHLREPISHFAASVDDIETLTGLDLFNALPIATQQELEATPNPLP
jgi:endonuclease G, mitochondrial